MLLSQQLNLGGLRVGLDVALMQDLAQPDHATALNHYSVIVFANGQYRIHGRNCNRFGGQP
jgi:hypothetical protein